MSMSDPFGDAASTSAPMIWGDLTSPVFKWSPGNPLPFADLATLKLDPTYGDGNYAGAPMSGNEHIRLGDGTIAWWDGLIWQAGTEGAGMGGQTVTPPWKDPSSYPMEVVKSSVTAHPDSCNIAPSTLVAEQEGQNRVTLITWLEGFIDSCEDIDDDELPPVSATVVPGPPQPDAEEDTDGTDTEGDE